MSRVRACGRRDEEAVEIARAVQLSLGSPGVAADSGSNREPDGEESRGSSDCDVGGNSHEESSPPAGSAGPGVVPAMPLRAKALIFTSEITSLQAAAREQSTRAAHARWVAAVHAEYEAQTSGKVAPVPADAHSSSEESQGSGDESSELSDTGSDFEPVDCCLMPATGLPDPDCLFRQPGAHSDDCIRGMNASCTLLCDVCEQFFHAACVGCPSREHMPGLQTQPYARFYVDGALKWACRGCRPSFVLPEAHMKKAETDKDRLRSDGCCGKANTGFHRPCLVQLTVINPHSSGAWPIQCAQCGFDYHRACMGDGRKVRHDGEWFCPNCMGPVRYGLTPQQLRVAKITLLSTQYVLDRLSRGARARRYVAGFKAAGLPIPDFVASDAQEHDHDDPSSSRWDHGGNQDRTWALNKSKVAAAMVPPAADPRRPPLEAPPLPQLKRKRRGGRRGDRHRTGADMSAAGLGDAHRTFLVGLAIEDMVRSVQVQAEATEQWIAMLTDRELLGKPLSHMIMASGQRTARGDVVARRMLSDARTDLFPDGWIFLLPSLPSQPRTAKQGPCQCLGCQDGTGMRCLGCTHRTCCRRLRESRGTAGSEQDYTRAQRREMSRYCVGGAPRERLSSDEDSSDEGDLPDRGIGRPGGPAGPDD